MNRLKRSWPVLLIGALLVATVVVGGAKLLSGSSPASSVRRDGFPPSPRKPEPLRLRSSPVSSGSATRVNRLRRSWPDLLIGVALVSVIAMIVGTLLTGKLIPSWRDAPPEAPITALPDTTRVTSKPTGAATVPADVTGTGSAQMNVQEARALTDSPLARLRAGTPPGGVAEIRERLPSAALAAEGFRVAAGALPSGDAAGTLAQNYRDGGYKVAVEQQGDLYLLWVGPYATQAAADAAAERITSDGGDALVYSYDESGADEAVAPPFTPSRNRDADGGAETGTMAVGAASVGQRYLQVGAFAFDGTDKPLRVQLESLGLNVTSDEDTSGLVRLYIGPFRGEQLTQTRARLSTQGIDSFPVVP